jgi:GNAT superfamily N-acetyltransferase
VKIGRAEEADAEEIASLRTAVANDLTFRHGRGHWSAPVSATSVARDIGTSRVLVARTRGEITGTLRLATKKPWAIDPRYFTVVEQPVYLVDMAVAPARQRQGIGRQLLEEASTMARGWPAGAIRLDAYDHAAGAGDFYVRCGYRETGRVVYRGVPLIYFELLFEG